MGEMSAAMTTTLQNNKQVNHQVLFAVRELVFGLLVLTYPWAPLRTALTVSLTPRCTSLSFMPFLTNLISFLLILSEARGSAMGLTKSLVSVILIIIKNSIIFEESADQLI